MKEWSYDPSPSISQSIGEQLTVFPRERDITFSLLRRVGTVFLRIFLKIYFRLEISGREHIPQNRSFVLVGNHASHLDAVALACALPISSVDHTFAVAAKDYFFTSFARSFFAAVFVNALPFDRHKKIRESLELCADALNASEQALLMFPEGTRSLDGKIQPFKRGIGILTAGTGRLVVPAFIAGAFEAWPKGLSFPKPKKVRVRIGPPLNFLNVERNAEGFQRVAQKVEDAVRALQV